MAHPLRKSVKLLFNLFRRERLNQELKHRLAEHDKQFLARIIDPDHEGGKYHDQYVEEVRKIREWYTQEQKGW